MSPSRQGFWHEFTCLTCLDVDHCSGNWLAFSKMLQKVDRTNSFAKLPDSAVLRILSYLSTNDLVRCSRLSRRFYFLSWEPELWRSVVLTGEEIDADLALKTIFRCIYLYCIQKFLQCCVVSMVALLYFASCKNLKV